MLSEREFKLYEKYKRARFLDKEDEPFIRELQSMGLARTPSSEYEGKPIEMAVLTPEGMGIYEMERTNRSPVRKFFSALVNV